MSLVNWLAALFKFGVCIGCRRRTAPMVGSYVAGTRRRRFAYCPACMPHLYEASR